MDKTLYINEYSIDTHLEYPCDFLFRKNKDHKLLKIVSDILKGNYQDKIKFKHFLKLPQQDRNILIIESLNQLADKLNTKVTHEGIIIQKGKYRVFLTNRCLSNCKITKKTKYIDPFSGKISKIKDNLIEIRLHDFVINYKDKKIIVELPISIVIMKI